MLYSLLVRLLNDSYLLNAVFPMEYPKKSISSKDSCSIPPPLHEEPRPAQHLPDFVLEHADKFRCEMFAAEIGLLLKTVPSSDMMTLTLGRMTLHDRTA